MKISKNDQKKNPYPYVHLDTDLILEDKLLFIRLIS